MKEFHREVLELIIKPTLILFERNGFSELNTPEAADLIYGTALAETGLREIEQEGGGPALGYWQMEPTTHDDIWENYLKYHLPLRKAVIDITGITPASISADREKVSGPGYHPLIYNQRYACLITRIHYLRYVTEIPDTPKGQAGCWLKNYNKGGKGSVGHYLAAWKEG